MLRHRTVTYIFIGLLIVIGTAYYFRLLSFWWVPTVLLMWLAIVTWASFDIRSNYFVKTYCSNLNIKTPTVALTFDDGPTPFTPAILDLLKQYNAKGTFFCIGQQVEEHPEIAKRIVAEGHLIANHSYSHPKQMGFLSTNQVTAEIKKADQTMNEILRLKNSFYRPPFGVTNPNIALACQQLAKKVIGWNIRSLDTVIKSEANILKQIIPRLRSGSIILLHDTSEKTTNVLEQLLIHLSEKKWSSVTVDQLLNIKKS